MRPRGLIGVASRILRIASAIVGLGIAAAAGAGSAWTSHGPSGPMGSLVVDPDLSGTVYTSGAQGLFKSTDDGQTWTSIVITGEPAFPLAAGPAETVYAGKLVFDAPGSPFYTSAVYKSADGGHTWNELFGGLWVSYGIVVDPKTPTSLFRISGIFSGDLHFPSDSGALDRSVDGGLTWTPADVGLELGSSVITALALDPQSPVTMYLATQSGGTPYGGTAAPSAMYKSTDGGTRWSAMENAPPNVSTIVVLPGALVLVSTDGVFRSTDAGETFVLINSTLNVEGRLPKAMVGDPLDASRLFAAHIFLGALESTDGGSTWTPINDGLTGGALFVTALAIDSRGAELYAKTEEPGVFTYPLRLPRGQIEPSAREFRRPIVVRRRPSTD